MNKSSTNKPRRSRKHCKRQYRKSKAATPESIIVNSNSKFQYPSKSHNNNEYIRSKSLTRIQSLDEIDTQMDHFPLKLHRIASWFKSNPMNSNTPISSANATPMETPNVTPSVKNVSRRVSSLYTRHNNYNIQEKITWRPSLNDICMDKHLSNALIEFMKRIYCEENILFLRAVQQFKCEIDQYIHFESDSDLKHNQKDTDFQIISIYNTYILSNSQYQVNLSYGNFMDSLKRKEAVSTLTIHQKREIFDNCVDEVERLIMSSVLSPFYDSAEFAVVAQQRPRSHGMGIGLEYNRDSIKIKKKSKNPIIKLIEKSPIMKTNSKSCNNKYDNDINHIDTQSNDSQDDINHINSPDTDSEIEDLIHNNSLFDVDDIDDPPYPIPYNIKNNTTASINAVSKLVKQMSQSTESLYDFEKKMARTGGSSKSIASAPIKRRK
eukprot:704638_1